MAGWGRCHLLLPPEVQAELPSLANQVQVGRVEATLVLGRGARSSVIPGGTDGTWRCVSLQDDDLSAVVARFKLLREKGVSGAAIVAHFLRNRLAPLQKRPHPAWDFQGPLDPSRLRSPDMDRALLRDNMIGMFTRDVKYELPAGFRPLCMTTRRRQRF